MLPSAVARRGAVCVAVVLAFVAGALFAPRPTAEAQAPGKGAWEYQLFVIDFQPANDPDGKATNPGPAGKQIQTIAGAGWQPAGFQRDFARGAWGGSACSHVLFKRSKK